MSLHPDQELIELIKQDSDNLKIVNKKTRKYCLHYMNKYAYDSNRDEIEDIYQDALIVLYEKIKDGNFELSCSIQTYLNSICYNQLLRVSKINQRTTPIETTDDDDDTYSKHEGGIDDWFPIDVHVNTERLERINDALQTMKTVKGDCYELLIQFFYHKKTMAQLATIFNYKDADTAKNLKARCQKKLKEMIQ
jgi:RNA polymerase sigma factor (sigma-70 family)